MKTPILLYSVNTWLAFCINENFYNQLHYVCCAPYFSSRDEQGAISGGVLPPRSSLPSEIYRELFLDVQSNDKDSAKIKANRLGLVNGAVEKYREGVLTEEQRDEIMIWLTKLQ